MCIQSLRGQPVSVKEGVVSPRMLWQSATKSSGHGIASVMLPWGRPWYVDLDTPMQLATCKWPLAPFFLHIQEKVLIGGLTLDQTAVMRGHCQRLRCLAHLQVIQNFEYVPTALALHRLFQ